MQTNDSILNPKVHPPRLNRNRLRLSRLITLAMTGGVVFQLTGCISGIVPVFVSFVESTVLSTLLVQAVGP